MTGTDNPSPDPLPCGFLVVDKPLGISSMGVVKAVRWRAGKPRTGHAGTLDPLATGVLVMCLGRQATRCVPRIHDMPKRYMTDIALDATSTTEDLEGDLTPIEPAGPPPDREAIRELLAARFIGGIMQRPPVFSAMQIDGKRAYKLARQGKPPELKARPVVIHSIEIVQYAWPALTLDVRCGKGTYIRSLARDIGAALGVGGYLTGLRRTEVGMFTVEQSIRLDDLPQTIGQSDLIPVSVLTEDNQTRG
ncbi:MAG: tRNA pseudouridine(55) synthase TruB [Planctomycetes bacterium]|nr:tRNA pseudouridine(55) synthase TruB [Planctomycetota bacterium]NOG55350.1 tRNA pseudouridine(55) synthase TruB [Planctomycetota bacterium]